MPEYKVLIVDDDGLIRNMLADWLEMAGYSVVRADNGASGLAALADCNPDVVITDISMPIVDGFEFCRRVRERSAVPILVFSAQPEQVARDSSLRAGADEYAPKHTRMPELLGRVRALVQNRGMRCNTGPPGLDTK